MRRFFKTLAYTIAAFYSGCLVPFAVVSVTALLAPGIPSWAMNVVIGVAIVAGLWTIPLVFNWLERRWPRPPPRHTPDAARHSSHMAAGAKERPKDWNVRPVLAVAALPECRAQDDAWTR